MKRITSIAAFLLIPFFSPAQSALPTNVGLAADERYEYCQILGEARFLSPKLSISVDYGQETQRIKDEEGKVKKFNSMVDALNFMTLEGWEFTQAYAFAIGNQNVYHYLLRRKVKK